MPDRASEIEELFQNMLSYFLEWDGVYQKDSIDRALLRTEANSIYKISKDIDRNLRSRFIVTAKGNDLDIIGEGMNRPRLAGESDENYKKRLIVNDTFFNDTTVKGIKNALRGYYGIDVDNDGLNDTKVVEVYRTALQAGSELNSDVKFMGEFVREGIIEVHLMMKQDNDEVIISRTELFDKIFKTRAAGILLYLIWHGNFEDNLNTKVRDTTSLIGKQIDLELGDTKKIIVSETKKVGLPIIGRHDIIDIRTKPSIKSKDYSLLVGTEKGLAKFNYKHKKGTENSVGGKRFEDDVSGGEMQSRRVHRLLNGESFALPKDFQVPMKIGQRNEIVLYNHENNITSEILRIKSKNENDVRVRVEDGTIKGSKVILQSVPREYNGLDLVFFGDAILTNYMMSGKLYNINYNKIINGGVIELDYNDELDEYLTEGYYITPPIHIDDITKFGMVKWVYNTGNVVVQFRCKGNEDDLLNLNDNDEWGNEYILNTGTFIQENPDSFFQIKISLKGTIFKSPTFRLAEFFVEYWDVSSEQIEEIYDNVENGLDFISMVENSNIGDIVLLNANANGNGGSNPLLRINKMQWVNTVKPIRQARIRNRRWSLFYGVKTIITDYFNRKNFFNYEREVECL